MKVVQSMFLCQMSGIPGAGKSTLARHICKMTNAVLLDLDVIKSSVLSSFENDIDFKFAGKIAYEMSYSLADSNLEMGNSVVIDSPCSYEIIIEQGTAIAKKHNAKYKFIECYLDIENLAELNRRRATREILPSQIYNVPIDEDIFQESIRSMIRPTGYDYLLIDTGQEIDKYIDTVMEYLGKPIDYEKRL